MSFRPDSVIIEPGAILRKTGRYQVQTNFHQSLSVPEYECERFEIATRMLKDARDRISLGLFRRILAATHEEQTYPTVYSNIYDLKRRVMYLYHFHNFENVVRIDLRAELKKGVHAVSLPSLFPKTHPAAAYLQTRAKEMHRVEPPVVKVDPSTFDDYAGSYRLESGVHFVILREADRLLLDAAAKSTASSAALTGATHRACACSDPSSAPPPPVDAEHLPHGLHGILGGPRAIGILPRGREVGAHEPRSHLRTNARRDHRVLLVSRDPQRRAQRLQQPVIRTSPHHQVAVEVHKGIAV